MGLYGLTCFLVIRCGDEHGLPDLRKIHVRQSSFNFLAFIVDISLQLFEFCNCLFVQIVAIVLVEGADVGGESLEG